ncbi:iron-containing alcohol dehydrogenase [Acidocella sp. KAb 2-4]|uniref:iron-containing alcohol dehydrogenase n=1 Tax=Acidocella sp. KAb 2-4 TaxID=2885158 RepID=UPI001D082330|nr:iron-containing alcohol dehydrogenase [Acidocella sp. KAb 2-4]MCB5944854.1 iron-containing alcohol dehydrogenase [Acidocella sp. KAb 2-4]
MQLKGNWRIPTEILAGAGRIAELPQRVKAAGLSRVLVVTDPGVAGLPFLASILKSLEAVGITPALFKDLHPDPQHADVLAGAAAYNAHGAEGVIAIGGGSGLDCGKSIALAVSTSRALWDFEITQATPDVDRPLPPIFAVPTTAGTGSEVGRASVVIDTEKRRKYILLHAQMLPRLVILDPELTFGLPPFITAWTGMDALAHSLEAYYGPFYHPIADGIAIEGMRLVKENLPTAFAEPHNADARMNMLAAASMGATAFQKALGAIHALSHPIGARFHAHHGLTNAVLMPYVLAYNRPVIEARIAHAARALGIENGFDGFLNWVLELRDALNIPHTLEALKVTPDALEELAEEAVADPNTPDNPRVANKADYLRILQAAMAGSLVGLGD